jgi:hypothetical protein
MKRLVTLATSGLFASGLAILPVSVFAQPANTAPTTDMKPATTAPAKVATHDAKDATVTKDTAKPTGIKTTTAHSGTTSPASGSTAPVGGAAKTGTHGAS